MAYPPAAPPVRTDSSLSAGNHAQDHNTLRAAVLDIIAQLGANPAGGYVDVGRRLDESVTAETFADFQESITGAIADAQSAAALTPNLPRQPALLGWASDPRLLGATWVITIPELGGLLTDRYAAVGRRSANAITVLDLIDPTAPVVVAELIDATNLVGINRMTRTGNTVVASCNGRMTNIDLSVPTAPVVLGTVVNSNLSDSGATNWIAVSVDGNTAYVTSAVSSGRFVTINNTTKSAPTFTAALADGVNILSPRGISVLSPTRVLIAGGTSDNVATLNVSNPAAVTVAASITDAVLDNPTHLNRRGSHLYVTTGAGRVVTLNTTNPDALTIEGVLFDSSAISGIGRATLLSTMLMMTTSIGGLVFVDVADPSAPRLAPGTRTLNGVNVWGIGTAYAASGDRYAVQVNGVLGRVNILGAAGLAPGGASRKVMSVLGHSQARMNGSQGTTYATVATKSTKSPHRYASLTDVVPWQLQQNGGSDGETSAQIRDRAYVAAVLYRTPLVEVWMNTNDIGDTTISADQSIANTVAVCELFLRQGTRVLLSNIAARTLTSDVTPFPQRAKMNAINAGLAAYAAATPGVFLNDYFTATNSGDGTPIAGLTYDGLHLTSTGAQVCGAVLKANRDAASAGLYLPDPLPLVAANAAPNAGLTGTAGTVGAGASGTFADSSTGVGFIGTAVTAAQRLQLGASATGTWTETGTVVVGDMVVGVVTLDADVFAKVTRFNLRLVAGGNTGYDFNPLTASGLSGTGGDDTVTNPIPSLGHGVTLRTAPVPATTTSADLVLTATTGAAGSIDVTVKSARISSILAAA